jgi:hypothetical protein
MRGAARAQVPPLASLPAAPPPLVESPHRATPPERYRPKGGGVRFSSCTLRRKGRIRRLNAVSNPRTRGGLRNGSAAAGRLFACVRSRRVPRTCTVRAVLCAACAAHHGQAQNKCTPDLPCNEYLFTGPARILPYRLLLANAGEERSSRRFEPTRFHYKPGRFKIVWTGRACSALTPSAFYAHQAGDRYFSLFFQ